MDPTLADTTVKVTVRPQELRLAEEGSLPCLTSPCTRLALKSLKLILTGESLEPGLKLAGTLRYLATGDKLKLKTPKALCLLREC